MYSGKTTTLLTRAHGRTLILNHILDTRTGDSVRTHDGVEVQALKCSELPELDQQYDTVLVDEGQFFESLDGVERLAPRVVVAGLSGDYLRRPFGKILSLVPKADKIVVLKAECACGDAAPFTKRIGGGSGLVNVTCTYVPVCGNCF